MVPIDEESRKRISDLEKNSRFPTGIGRIDRGECPLGGLNPMECMFCSYGHMLECHYPYTCEEAQCSHWEREMDEEANDPYWEEDEPL
jgi:hypothetical protein